MAHQVAAFWSTERDTCDERNRPSPSASGRRNDRRSFFVRAKRDKQNICHPLRGTALDEVVVNCFGQLGVLDDQLVGRDAELVQVLAESAISATTVLLVAARAVNILR